MLRSPAMPIDGFQHVNLRPADLEASREFYVRVLGLRVGERPPFASTGYWLYWGDAAIVHLVQRAPGEPASTGSGAVDHLAFHALDLEGTRRLLHDAGMPFREAVVPRDGNVQIFLHDPDGVKIELNFAPVPG